MQLSTSLGFAVLLLVAGLFSGPVLAQSLAPTRGTGPTPGAIKGFRLSVGNPYKTRMSFRIIPMDAGFVAPVGDAVAQPERLTLAPGYSRQVILAFKIPPPAKERTIGLCITPEHIAGPVLPRVCGIYTGVLLAGAGG